MKVSKLLYVAGIVAAGLFLFLNSKGEVDSAGGSMPTVSAAGCTANGRKYIYYAINSFIPVKFQISNFYAQQNYFSRSTTTGIKRVFVVDVTNKYNAGDPTFTYKLYNMSDPGVTDETPLLYGNVRAENTSCTYTAAYYKLLGYNTATITLAK